MMDYKISIIVPVYNTEKYIKKCVDSLINQTYRNLEIILVDDGSTDGSSLLCDEFAEKDRRIRVVHKENGGLISAWKAGVQESTGSYLNFVDSDDWVDCSMIEEMAEYLSGETQEIIASDYVIERDKGDKSYVWQQLAPGEYDRKALTEKVIPNLLGHESRYVTISRCMKLITRELIENNMKYSNPDIMLGEDITIMLPALIDCSRLVIMEHKAYYHYLYVKESMIHKYDRNLYDNIKLLQQIILQILQDKFAGEKLEESKKQADREYVFSLMLVAKNESRGNPKGYYQNLIRIFKTEEMKSFLQQTPVVVKQNANRLLYLVMKHPNGFTIRLLRLAMIVYYR